MKKPCAAIIFVLMLMTGKNLYGDETTRYPKGSAGLPSGSGMMNATNTGNETVRTGAGAGMDMGPSGMTDQEQLRDPFLKYLMPPQLQTAVTQMQMGNIKDVQLEGVGLGPRDAYAVLNDEVYFEGEEKDGIKLIAVRRGEADIKDSKGSRTIKLLPDADIERLKKRAERKALQSQ